jgi:hypothetical protein
MRTIPNGDGSVRPDVPRIVLRLGGLFFRVLWNCIPACALVNACCNSNGSALDRVILWIHGNWPLWDQEPNEKVRV